MGIPASGPAGCLESLTRSLVLAQEAVPALHLLPPAADSMSLLRTQNRLFRSYLAHLVLLIIIRIRHQRQDGDGDTQPGAKADLDNAVVEQLVAMRHQLGHGVRPLLDRMRYQLDLLTRAADEADRAAGRVKRSGGGKRAGGGRVNDSGEEDEDEDEDEDENEDEEQDGDGDDHDHSDAWSSDRGEDAPAQTARPRLSALVPVGRPRDHDHRHDHHHQAETADAAAFDNGNDAPGIYRPPRRERALMEPPTAGRRDARRRPIRSATLDEFVADEMSTAPLAQPSVGTNLEARGRRVKTATDRAAETERREYEETNLRRLPRESRRDRATARGRDGKRGAGGGRMVFGGEDFRDISGHVDRIERLTKLRDGEGGKGAGVRALLEKSRRKRGREDGPGGGGGGIEKRARR